VLSLFEGLPMWVLHASGLSLTLGRLVHAWGLHTSAFNWARVTGTTLSWISYLILGVALIYAGLSHQLGG
jgi:uncharacterized membrane protein YecN with MAPEG domain